MTMVDFGTINHRTSGTGEEFCDKDGAMVIKMKIEAYWRERGHVVQVDLKEAGFNAAMRSVRWDVRSNLVGGFPPGFKNNR